MTDGTSRRRGVQALIGSLAIGCLLLIPLVYSQDAGRITDGILAIYPFQTGTGVMAYDESGVKDTLHLTMSDPTAVRWVPGGGLAFDTETSVAALRPTTKITQGVQASHALSLELWMTPPNQNPKSQGEILSLLGASPEPVLRLTQADSPQGPADHLIVELQTSESKTLIPVSTLPGSLTNALTHLIYTRAPDGTTRLHHNGQDVAQGHAGGDFTSWPDSLSLHLGNAHTNDRPWLGEMTFVALFDHALTAQEVAQHFASGPGTKIVPPAITLDKRPRSASVLPGKPIPFTLTVRNDGQEVLENVVVSDPGCGPLTFVPRGKHFRKPQQLIPGQTWRYNCTLQGMTKTKHSQATVHATTDTGVLVQASASATTAAATSAERITDGQVVLYDFLEGSGTTVTDVSNVVTPLNLTINNENNVTWLSTGGLSLDTNTLITSSAAATKVITALQATNHSSVELWVKAANLTQSGPARMFSIGNDITFQNLVVGQDGDDYQIRLLHTDKAAQANPRLITTDQAVSTNLVHLVHTYDGTTERLYIDGVQHPTTVSRSGVFSNWDASDPLNLGNEASGDRPWLGELRLAAIFDRALSSADVMHNFSVGPPTPGTGSPLQITNLSVTSGEPYQVITDGLQVGELVYIDRGYTFTTIPSALVGQTYIKTANDDKNSTGTSFLTFDVNQEVTVYVAHDVRITPRPTWLTSAFTDTGEDLVNTDSPLDVFSQVFPAGTVTLGGNQVSTTGKSMYSVVIVPTGAGPDTESPSAPGALTFFNTSETGVTVQWGPATDNVEVTDYLISRCQGSGCTNYSQISTVSGVTTQLIDTGLQPNMTYGYQVEAQDAAGNVGPPTTGEVTTLPDTTNPTASITAPPEGANVSGAVTVSATASDNIAVVGVQFFLDGTPLGAEALLAPYEITWDTTLTPNGVHSLTAQARDAAGNLGNATAVNVTIDNPIIPLTITNLTVASGEPYEIVPDGLIVGELPYIDRLFTFATIPNELVQKTFLRTANDDKTATDTNFLNFDVNQSVVVYVGHDTRVVNKPAWLSAFNTTGMNMIDSNDTTFDLFSQTFPSGTITLGGNGGTFNGSSMYTVVVTPISPPGNLPVANAGAFNHTVPVGNAVTFNGNLSVDPGGQTLTFNWVLTNQPTGSTAVLTNPTSATPTLVTDVAGVYTVQLIVNNGTDDSLPDFRTVTADAALPLNERRLDANFDAGRVGLVYQDDAFRATNLPLYASGFHLPTGGFAGGGLQVQLGGVDENPSRTNMSGGWQAAVTLSEPEDVTLTFRYNFIHDGAFEGDERSEALVSVDGTLHGTPPNDFIAELIGDGQSGPDLTTGWQTFQVALGELSSGTHLFTFGGYLNKKTAQEEVATVLIDDVDLALISSQDTIPPVVTAPTDITVAADNSGGTFAFNPLIETFHNGGTAVDDVDGVVSAFPDFPVFYALGQTPVVFSAIDSAGNVGTATAIVTVLDLTPPSITVPDDIVVPPIDTNGTPITDSTIQQFLNDATAFDNVDAVLPVTHDALSLFPLGPTVVTFSAVDSAGNTTNTTATVTIADGMPPVLAFTDPVDLGLVNASPITVSGSVDDSTATVVVNGVLATIADGTFTANDVPLQEGVNTITATATDPFGNFVQAAIQVALLTPPVITITQPANLEVINQDTISVSGTVDDPNATVEVNGIAATTSGGTFTAVGVPIREGNSVLTAAATNAAGNVGTASMQVTRDLTPPIVTIDSPGEGFITDASSVTVTGMINDIVVGTVNGSQAQVTVNGVQAQVSNRKFLATNVPLNFGDNSITAVGTDQAGNIATATRTITQVSFGSEIVLRMVSGNNQVGTIGSTLSNSLVAVVEAGELSFPIEGIPVVFRVTQNNGTVSDGLTTSRAIIVTSDANGLVQVNWTLGSRSGAGNQIVEATGVGSSGKVIFSATGLAGTPNNISMDSGNNQTGIVGRPLPRPLVAVVTDTGNNRLAGAQVTFTALGGGSHFNGQTSVIVTTDSDGRAFAVPTLGFQEGVENTIVTANFPGNVSVPASFRLSARAVGDPSQTKVSGVVLDNTNQPIQGVTLRIEGKALTTQTDGQGLFLLEPVPVGTVHLEADGSTVQQPGTWPTLEYELVTIAGQNNTIGMPIYLLPLDIPNGLFVSATSGGILTPPQLPGFALTVEPGAATFPDGSQSGTVSVTVVHADKVPMTPNFGQQPQLVVTIQPPGVHFNPPAAITMPNTNGLAPGDITDIFSFDHDLGQFVSIGTGSVSEDGMKVVSDPGVGIIKGGWHHPDCKCSGSSGSCCDCSDCQSCNNSSCVNDDSATPKQVEGNCQLESCAGGTIARSDDDSDAPPGKDCCQGDVLDPENQCCEANGILAKNPIADLDQCPNRVPNPDHMLMPNGCTGVPNNPMLLLNSGNAEYLGLHFANEGNFLLACNDHDDCYDGCNNNKGGCDSTFGAQLTAICINDYSGPLSSEFLAQCIGLAQQYQEGVEFFEVFYKDAQKLACNCCP